MDSLLAERRRPEMVAGLADMQWPLRTYEGHLEVDAEVSGDDTSTCDVCNEEMQRHGKRVTVYADVPWCGLAVRIHVHFRRYRCSRCGITRKSEVSGLAQRRNVTERLINYVREQVPLQSVTSVAHHLRLDEKTIRNIFQENAPLHLEDQRHFYPRILGVIRHSAQSNRYTIFVDIAERRILDVIKTDSARSVQTWIDKLPAKEGIFAVVMDMVRSYRIAASRSLPSARLVVDPKLLEEVIKDHVVKNWGGKERFKRRSLPPGAMLLTKRERSLSQKAGGVLHRMVARNPLLNRDWTCKEKLLQIFDEGNDKRMATEDLASWRASVSPEIVRGFSPLIRLVDDWGPRLIESIGIDLLEGYAAGRNRLLSTIGRGHMPFDRFRARALSATPAFQDALDICDYCLQMRLRNTMHVVPTWYSPPVKKKLSRFHILSACSDCNRTATGTRAIATA